MSLSPTSLGRCAPLYACDNCGRDFGTDPTRRNYSRDGRTICRCDCWFNDTRGPVHQQGCASSVCFERAVLGVCEWQQKGPLPVDYGRKPEPALFAWSALDNSADFVLRLSRDDGSKTRRVMMVKKNGRNRSGFDVNTTMQELLGALEQDKKEGAK